MSKYGVHTSNRAVCAILLPFGERRLLIDLTGAILPPCQENIMKEKKKF